MTTERIDIVVTERGSRVVKRNLEEIGSSAKQSSAGVDFLKRTLATLGAALGVQEVLRTIDAYTNLQNRLRSTGIEGQNLLGVYQELLKASNETRSSVQGSVELYSRLALSSKELGVSQRQLIDFTKSLNQAILLSGASATEAEAGLIQLSQGMASGTLRGDELRSVLEQLPAVADVIAKNLGVTRGELRALGTDGKITAQTILDAFKDARVELEERFGKTVPTLSQSLQVLKNNFVNALGEFDKAIGLSATLSKALLFLADNIDTILKAALGLAAGWVVVYGGAEAFYAVRNAVVALNIAIAANPIGFLLTVLTSAIALLVLFRDEIKLGTNDLTSLGDFMRAFGEAAAPAFRKVLDAARALFGPLIDQIEAFLGEIDFSIAGILRATAKAVDFYMGAWFGAIGAVVAYFQGFGPAVADIVTTALNIVLKKISNFVNTAGQLLSSLTDFAGLGKIATIDLQLSNENAGAVKKLGQDVSAAFTAGIGQTTAQDMLQDIFDRADQIALERKAAMDAAQGDVSSVAPAATGKGAAADDEKKKKTRDLAEELKNLVSQYDSVYAAQQEYLAATKLLNEADAAGLISAERKAEVLGMIKEQLADSLDPLAAINREMDKERELLKLTADAREIETQVRAIELELKMKGVALSAVEIAQLREKLGLIQAETKASEARNQVLEQVRGQQTDYTIQLQAINDLIRTGAITQGEANTLILSQNAELLAGTIESELAITAAYEARYARINELADAHLVSEQTRAQVLANLEREQFMRRFEGASKFFGTLSALSRSENKKLAAIGKAAAIAQATIDGFAAVQAALKGPPGPPWSYAIAAATAAVAGANVAQIAAQPLPGFAFGGDFKVPGTGATDSQTVAFRATPGERVTVSTPAQDREEARKNNQQQASSAPNFRIINVLDPAMVGDFLESPEGEMVLVNQIRRNQELLK